MNSIEKLELWTKAEVNDVEPHRWPGIATEICSLLSGCSADEIVNLNCSADSKLLDNLISQPEFNDLYNLPESFLCLVISQRRLRNMFLSIIE
jgi:hypothetical protein